MKYPLAETFTSVIGEGCWTGHPANFIRLAGCPVGCAFCDTDYKERELVDTTVLVNRIDRRIPIVVITGGEPAIHPLTELVTRLLNEGLTLHLETTGGFEIPTGLFHWVAVSPKRDVPVIIPKEEISEVKWLYPVWQIDEYNWRLCDRHFIQPLHYGLQTPRNAKEALAALLRNRPPKHKLLALSFQAHKMYDFR